MARPLTEVELGIGYLTEKVEEMGSSRKKEEGASWSFTMVAGAGLLVDGRGGGFKQVDIRSKSLQG